MAFGDGDHVLSNQQIASKTGFSPSAVTRLAHALRKLGYLVDFGPRGTFALGPAILKLGYSTLSNQSLTTRARPHMEKLADLLGGSVGLGACDSLEVVFYELIRGNSAVITASHVGSRLPIENTAIGRAILAGMPEEARREKMKQLFKEKSVDMKQLEKNVQTAMDELEEKGFCASMGDWNRNIFAVAAPIMDVESGMIFGINLSQPSVMMTQEEMMLLAGPKIAEVARSLTKYSGV